MAPSTQPGPREGSCQSSCSVIWSVQMAPEYPQASYYRARYYDLTAGRFLSQDPIGFYAGTNSYAYVGNSPISLLDPLGLCPCQAGSDHPNSNHPFFPIHTGGLVVGANGEAGLGSIGGSAASGNVGFGESGSHMGLVASGAVATNAGNYAGGTPHQDVKTTGVYGAFVGGGASLFVSNGQPCDLQGPFKTLNFNLGIGFISWSASLALGENGVYQVTFSPVGWGLGASVSAYTTNTKVSPCCN
jgi:RHS repeat-associated protein